MSKIKNIISGIILLVTFALVLLLFVTKVSGGTPQAFGYQLLRISSPSMEPQLASGDIILSKSIDDAWDVKVGDIITYNGEQGDYAGKMITHQVVIAPYEKDGECVLQTQGIANDYPDPEITSDQLIGTMVCKITVLSAIYNFFMTPWGLIVILGFLAVLFINEIFALRQLVKENDYENEQTENSSSEAYEEENIHVEDSQA